MATFLLTMMTIQTTTTTMRLKNTKTIINSSYGKSIIRSMAFAAKGGASRGITSSSTSSKRSINFVRLAATNNNQRFAMMTMMSSSSRGQKTTTAAVGKGVKPVPVPDNEELPFSRSAHHPWGENDERFLGNDEDKETCDTCKETISFSILSLFPPPAE